MPKTWFLPPDFTFAADGPLRLGMVISHWSRPTAVLATVGSGSASDIQLPATTVIVEPNHAHRRSNSRSGGTAMLLKFAGFASAAVDGDIGRSTTIDYSNTDHEIRSFSDPLTPETVAAIANLPAVGEHMRSGIFGKQPVYIVTGLRIATSSFTVTTEKSSRVTLEAEGSGPPATPVPVEIGGRFSHSSQSSVTDSYDTAPGVVFAYQVHAIRTLRPGKETELFTHRSAFLTGGPNKRDEPLVLIEADQKEIDADLEEEVDYRYVENEGQAFIKCY